MHVGNGQTNPDHFVWRLTPNLLSGNWIYNGDIGGYKAGGLSNFKLYSAGTGTRVPDTGSTILLLGIGHGLLGYLKRRK